MIDNLKSEIIEFAKIAGLKGFTPGISGNISVRCKEGILITASGSANGFLNSEDLILIDFDGNVIDGNKKPSSEKFLHLEFYKTRDDVNSIFHVHSPYLTAFAASGKDLSEAISPEIVYCFGGIPLAKYSIPGSKELVDKTSVYFKEHDVILMENHGVIVAGNSVKQAFLNLDLAEEYAKTLLFAKLLGGAKILSEDEVEKIYSLRS